MSANYIYTSTDPDTQARTRQLWTWLENGQMAAQIARFRADAYNMLASTAPDVDVQVGLGDEGSLMTKAAFKFFPEIVFRLIELGVDTEVRNQSGFVAMHYALSNDRLLDQEQVPMAQRLLAAGTSVHAVGFRFEQTLEDFAVPATEKILQDHKARWQPRLEAFRAGSYTPSCREDFLHLATMLQLEDQEVYSSVASRLQMLHDMRPDTGLGNVREMAGAIHARKAEGI